MSQPTTRLSWEDAVRQLRADPSQQELVRAAFYDDPLIDAARRYYQSAEWRGVRRFLPDSTGLALDVGAGRGIASYALAMEGFRVNSLEPNPSELVGAKAIRDLASQANLQIEVFEGVTEQIPFASASFDLVFARAVLHHSTSLNDSCREVFRVLKPSGVFIAIREHVISSPNDLSVFLNSHPLHRLYGGEHAYLLSEYRLAFRNAGFSIIHQLQPLLSPINYFPHSHQSLLAEIGSRIGARVPIFERMFYRISSNDRTARGVLALAALADNRPGRLYSFICHKPALS